MCISVRVQRVRAIVCASAYECACICGVFAYE